MKYLQIIIIFLFLSCKKQESKISLSSLNKELITYKQGAERDTTNYVTLKLENKTNKIYYINAIENKIRFKDAIFNIGSNYFIRVFNKNNEEKYSYNSIYSDTNIKNSFKKNTYFELGYKYSLIKYQNTGSNFSFFIHPNEILYFEYPIRLTSNLDYEFVSSFYAEIKDNQKYYANITLFSDSTEYKKFLPRDVLQTIKENNVEVYHGFIVSNKLPVRVLE